MPPMGVLGPRQSSVAAGGPLLFLSAHTQEAGRRLEAFPGHPCRPRAPDGAGPGALVWEAKALQLVPWPSPSRPVPVPVCPPPPLGHGCPGLFLQLLGDLRLWLSCPLHPSLPSPVSLWSWESQPWGRCPLVSGLGWERAGLPSG